MKIVLANNFYYLRGGSERVLFDEIKALEGQGHEVVPFSRQCKENLPTMNEDLFLPVVEYEKVRGIQKLRAALDIIYSRSQKAHFQQLLQRERPSLVHGHNIYGGLTFSIVDAGQEFGVPFVLTLHDLKLVCPSYLMLNHGEVCERCLGGRFWNCAIQRCHKNSLAASLVYTLEAYFHAWRGTWDRISRLLCPSRFLMEQHIAAGFPEGKLAYIPNGLDPTAYEPSPTHGDYVLFAGRLSREKGIHTLLKAFGETDIPLRVAGGGPLETWARKYTQNEGMGNVRFEGYSTGEALRLLYQGAAFVVVPSECYENAPMSILEAFAYGKPVVGSRIGGIPELVLDGRTGLLFTPGDAEDLKEKVTDLWVNKPRITTMGKEARNRIENEFSAQRHLEVLLEVYGSAIQARGN